MKYNISDLLDACSDESVDLDSGTPLSSSRIKELTMSKITQKHPRKLRTPVRVLIAAAIVAALSVSALAANHILGAGTLLQDYFTEGQETLTPGQVEVMDEIGKTFEGGVTSNGTTITPIAALADENVYYLRLRIEAPEDVVLPDLDGNTDGYYQLFGMGEDEFITLVPEAGIYESFGWNLSLDWLPDSDPTDNIKEVVLRYTVAGDEKFNDGVSKLLTIHGLWVQSPDNGYTQILSGEFTFDIGMYYESKIIALNCEGATYYSQTGEFTNRLESMELSPLSLSYRFQSTMLDNSWYGPTVFGIIQIVLKDGTVFYDESRETISRSDISAAEPEFDIPVSDDFVTDHEECIFFDTPLDLTQVDYVQYGEYKIPVVIE